MITTNINLTIQLRNKEDQIWAPPAELFNLKVVIAV